MSKIDEIKYVVFDEGVDTVYRNPRDNQFIKLSENYKKGEESQQKINSEQITFNNNLNDLLQCLQLQNYEEYRKCNDRIENLENFNLIIFQKISNLERNIYLRFYKTIIFVKDFKSFIYVSIFNRKNNQLTNYILGEYIKSSYDFNSWIEKQLNIQITSQNCHYKYECQANQVYLFAAYFFCTCFSGKIENQITLKIINSFIESKENPDVSDILTKLVNEIDENLAYNKYKSQFKNQQINGSNNFENSLLKYIQELEKDYANNQKKITLKYINRFSIDQIQLSTDDSIIISLIDIFYNQSYFIIIISENRSNLQINLSLNSKENNTYSDYIKSQIRNQGQTLTKLLNIQQISIKYLYFLIEKIWQKQGIIEERDLQIDMNESDSIFEYVKETDLMLIKNDVNQLCLVLKLRQYFYGKLDHNLNFQSGVKTEQSVDNNFNYSYSDYIGQFENDQIITKLGVSTQFKTNLDFQDIISKIPESKSTETQTTSWARYNQLFNMNDVRILHSSSQQFLNSSILDGWGLYLNQQNEELFFNQLSIENAKKFRRLFVLESFFYTYLTSYSLCEKDIKLKFSEFIKFKIDIFDVYQDLCFIINKKELHWFMIKAEITKNILIYTIYDSMSLFPEYYREYTDTLDSLFTKIFQKNYITIIQVADVYRQNDGFSCGYHVAHFLEQIHLQKTQFERLNLQQMKQRLLDKIVNQSDLQK